MKLQKEIDNLLSLTSEPSLERALQHYSEIRTSLERQIREHRSGVTHGSETDEAERSFACLLLEYYRLSGCTAHLEECISIRQKLVGPLGGICISSSLRDDLEQLGDALRMRYEDLGEVDDLESAAMFYEHALCLHMEHNSEIEYSQCGLGIIYSIQYLSLNQLHSYSRGRDLLLRVLSTSNKMLQVRALAYLSLGESQHNGAFTDLSLAIEHACQALTLGTLDSSDHILACIAGVFATGIYPRAELESFCLYTYRLCSALGHPYQAQVGLQYYQTIFYNAHQHSCVALEGYIIGFRNLWQCYPSTRLLASCFGQALGETFQATGSLGYLDEQIMVFRKANKTESIMNNLAVSLCHRYSVTGQVADLHESIHIQEMLLETDSPKKLIFGLNLAECLLLQFRTSGARVHLLRAVELANSGITILANTTDHNRETIGPADAALNVYKYASENGMAVDLDKAQTVLRSMLSHCSESESSAYILFNALATCMHLQSTQSTHTETMREAISLRWHALSLLEQDQHRYLEYLAYLASDYAHLGVLSNSREQIEQAAQYFSQIVQSSYLSPLDRLKYAISWCDAVATTDSATPGLAFRNAISLLPQAITFGGDFQSRLDVLKRAPRLSTDAAMHAIGASQVTEAVQLLEQGRTVLWTQLLSARGKLYGLPEVLGKHLIETHRALDMSGTSLGRRQYLMTELEKLIGEVRLLPGREHFLSAPPYSTLKTAAMHGPLVVLISNETSAAALIILESSAQPLSVNLRGVNRAIAQKMTSALNVEITWRREAASVQPEGGRKMFKHLSRKQGHSSEYDVLQLLWDLVVHPVLNALGMNVPKSKEQRLRLFWCPTGPFAFLPLHAAGKYRGDNRQCASDYIISSYTPTITALLNAQQDPPTHPIGEGGSPVLLAAIPNAPGHAPIVNTLEEARLVRDIVSGTRALAGDVSSDQFLAEMPSAKFLHLACHGKQAAEDPLESGFVFQDGMVKMSTLLDVKVPDACFAFLSACESAMGDKDLPDENIHLAATMLFIGYRSVVGTLWSMHDADGPTVASRVYSELAKNTRVFDYNTVPRALDAAMRELRDTGAPPSRWATWIHMGI